MSLSFNFNITPSATTPSFNPTTPSFGATTSTPSFNPTPSSFGPSTASAPAFGSAPSFGAPSTAPSLFSALAPATSANPSFSPFGATATAPAASTTSSFPSFSTPSLTPSFTTPPSLTTTSIGTPSLFGAATTTAPSFATPSTTTTTNSPFFSSATPFASPISTLSSTSTPLGGPVNSQTVIGATKFSDLPADIQANLEKLSKLIIDQKVVGEEISRRTADDIPQIKDNAGSLIEKVAGLTNLIQVDAKAVTSFKSEVLNDVRTVESAYNDSYRLKSPNLFSQTIVLPPRFFWDLVETFDGKLKQYSATIADIESYLSSVNAKKAADPRTLGESIRAQYDIFVAVAERLAVVHDALEDRKEEFRGYRRKYSADSADPFEPKKKSVLAPFPIPVTQAPATPTNSAYSAASSLSRTTPSTPSFFSPSGTTTANAGTALFGTPVSSATSGSLSFASPAASTLSFGATPSPASTFSFATPATPTTPSAFGTTGLGTPAAAGVATIPYGSTSSIGSGSSFGSGASSAFGSTSSFGSSASPFGTIAAAAAAATNPATNSQKKNSLSNSQSRSGGRKKSSVNRSTSV